MIYLDYAATTPLDPRVKTKMIDVLELYGNPASIHALGLKAKEIVELAREHVAALIGADASEIIWTSGATESNNLALKGAALLYQSKGKHIITMKTEHLSVLDPCQLLEKQGFQVTYLTPDTSGMLNMNELKAAVRADTILISVMHVNNELGTIQPIEKIAEFTSKNNILFHVDAAQSVGKLPLNMQVTPIDLVSMSSHKLYGPKGIGALYVRRKPRVRLFPQIHGGGHEQGMRSGTLATHQIAGFGTAANIAQSEMSKDFDHCCVLRQLFLDKIRDLAALNGDGAEMYPGIMNLRLKFLRGRELLQSLPQIAMSVGSACLSKGIEPSYVLRALGQSREEAHHGVRISFGRFTLKNEVEDAAEAIASLLKNNIK